MLVCRHDTCIKRHASSCQQHHLLQGAAAGFEEANSVNTKLTGLQSITHNEPQHQGLASCLRIVFPSHADLQQMLWNTAHMNLPQRDACMKWLCRGRLASSAPLPQQVLPAGVASAKRYMKYGCAAHFRHVCTRPAPALNSFQTYALESQQPAEITAQ
jgi:hypothetical protein